MHASLETVLKSNVYMCFYVKRHLDYKPFSLPTYKIARENEAVKEREKEKEKEREKEKELEDALLGIIWSGGCFIFVVFCVIMFICTVYILM